MPGIHSVLIVDDEQVQANILGEILSHQGLDTATETDPERALAMVQSQSFDLVISDLKMPRMDGIAFLRRLRRLHPDLLVIMMTAYGTVETAVAAMREGAYDYVLKPFSKEELVITVQRALANLNMRRENTYLRETLGFQDGTTAMVGQSGAITAVVRMVDKIAQDDKATVLIQGETGTGKNVAARLLHTRSPRNESPFIVVNCAAIPEGLMESELFGHEKGAFTGAVAARPGRFELADGGTLFLDEVGELNGVMQGKLLRVLETKEFERVGGTRTLHVNVRIIAATNRDLSEEVRTRRFREDLFYRLNILPVTLPPLRERREDIPLLAAHFLERFHREGKRRMQLSPAALDLLMRYDYPGNVRELANLLERAVILSDETVITPSAIHLQPAAPRADATEPPPAEEPGATLAAIGQRASERAETRTIIEALRKTNWNRARAAQALGIDAKTLRTKIRRYGITAGGC